MTDFTDDRGIPPDYDPADLRPPARWELVREGRVVFERVALAATIPRIRREGASRVRRARHGGARLCHRRLLDRAFAVVPLVDRLRRPRSGPRPATADGVPKLIPAVVEQTEKLASDCGQPIRLIGWSLGGYLVREVARERPDLVERVITLGAPVVGGPAYTASAPMYLKRGYDLEEIASTVLEREERPIIVPVFAVYSRSDGVVKWQSCIDTFDNPLVEHHEVASTHLGMVNSPRVFRLAAELLV